MTKVYANDDFMYLNFPDAETASWQNQLIDDYDKDYAPGRRICIDDATPAEWDALGKNKKPRSQQIGGEHYRQGSIQPIEYIHANDMDFFSGNVVKYVTRWKYKNGLEDLKKAKHYIELLMEQEYGYNG